MLPRFEPHSHTAYSNLRLLDCINMPKNLVKYAKEIGLAGICITDHEALSCHVELSILQKEMPDFKIGLGNEIYLVEKRESGIVYYHFILIALDEIGHKQLRKLSSTAWLNSYSDRGMERVPTLKEELVRIVQEQPGHLVATTACLGGELSTKVLEMEKARMVNDNQTALSAYQDIINFLELMKNTFEDNFYIEIAPGSSKDQVIVNRKLLEIAKLYKIKMVIGSDAHYLTKEDRYVHKAYLNSKSSKEREVDAFYEFSYLQEEEDIIKNLEPSFSDDTQDVYRWLCSNSMEIFNKIQTIDLTHKQQIPSVPVKKYERSQWWGVNNSYADDMMAFPTLRKMFLSESIYDRYWVNECWSKLEKLGKGFTTGDDLTYIERLEEEARVKSIIGEKLETNMFKYPITLQHYVDMFWKKGSIVGAGRGSSCSGLNHYLLGITQLDPIAWNLPFWRYLNDERTELGDIDLDLCPSKKEAILKDIKEERGHFFNADINEISVKNLGCTLIATFGTETTKSAVLTACRGYRSDDFPDGIDSDTSQYISSLIPKERGFLWPLKEVLEGDRDKGRRPVTTFINKVSEYPGLIEIMSGIEGLISQRSSHASGVILFDEDPYEFGCFMKTPSGDIITQYDLHMAEAAGMTKYDFLVTSVQDKIKQAIKFLQENNLIEQDLSLREVYDKYFNPNVLPIDRKDIWKAIQNNEVINIFQFDSLVGAQAAKKIKPTNILELADANGLMRLMTAEQGEENPMDKYVRFKNNINLWYREMDSYGLTKEEQEYLKPYFAQSYGVPPSQEQMMMMLIDKNLCGFSLKDANNARKIVGKKLMSKIPELREQVYAQARSAALGKYIWECGIGPQMGYSFSIIHALAYSFIGFQTAYTAVNWNSIYWNTACLVVNSGSLEDELDIIEVDEDNNIIKKKEKGSDYAKMATAIGEIKSQGIKVSLVDINNSDFGFKPDVKNNQILFGMKALSNINSDIINKIKAGRPYSGIKDFVIRCPLPKIAMVNLIKAGAFDSVETAFKDRRTIMAFYIYQVCERKNRLTLQNFNGLIQKNLIPEELTMQIRVFNFNKYLKTKKVGKYYTFDDSCITFFNNFMQEKTESLEVINGITCILQENWDKIYKKEMDIARTWLKNNHDKTLKEYNTILFKECWDKYAAGTISKWEMDSLCFYHGEHELINIDVNKYGIVDFFSLSPDSAVEYTFRRNNRDIPIFKLNRIMGTVIAKDDNKSTISLLTTTGVVTVKFSREYYANYKKQISEIGADGKKHVVEKGWFTKGSMIVVNGFRREDTFVAKTYANTNSHQLYKILDVVDTEIKITNARYTSSSSMLEENEE